MKPIFFFKKLATNFLELETTFKYLEAKRLLDKNVNFVPCSCDKHFHEYGELLFHHQLTRRSCLVQDMCPFLPNWYQRLLAVSLWTWQTYCRPICDWLNRNRKPFLMVLATQVSKKCRQVEIQEILTWTEAFTIFQMVTCTTHSYRTPDLTKYKLLIIQTARQSPGRACLEHRLAFRKDAAATGLSD